MISFFFNSFKWACYLCIITACTNYFAWQYLYTGHRQVSPPEVKIIRRAWVGNYQCPVYEKPTTDSNRPHYVAPIEHVRVIKDLNEEWLLIRRDNHNVWLQRSCLATGALLAELPK